MMHSCEKFLRGKNKVNNLMWFSLAVCLIALSGNVSVQAQVCHDLMCQEVCETLTPDLLAVSEHCNYLKPRRIVIVTAKNREDRLDEQSLLAELLAKHLAGPFSTVVSRESVCADDLPMRKGVFDERELVQLKRAYQADAVLYCEIQRLVAYEPMQLEASLLLVDINQAVSLLSLHTKFDVRQIATRLSYANFATPTGQPSVLSETHVHSPSTFIEFAALQLSQQMCAAWGQHAK